MMDLTAFSWKVLRFGVAVLLLGVLIAPAAWADVVIANAGFETPEYALNSHNYKGITGTEWTHTGRSGIDRGNPFGAAVSNCFPSEGAQMAFLQGDAGYTNGVTSLGQDISGFIVGEAYMLSFDAKAISGYSGANPFSVSVGGIDLFGLITPDTLYQEYISGPIVATAETMNLLFYDQGNFNSGCVSFIDDVQIAPYEINLVANGSFETPVFQGNVHNYQTISDLNTQWTHEGRSGIDRGNIFGAAAPNCAPSEGSQMAFLQGDSGNTYTPAADGVTKLGQSISDLEVGEYYVLSFEAMGMNGYSGANPFYASIDGNDLFGLITPTTEYQEYVSEPFLATAETMDLLFRDQGNMAGGYVTWIDAVSITPTEVPEPGLISLLLTGMITTLVFFNRRRTSQA